MEFMDWQGLAVERGGGGRGVFGGVQSPDYNMIISP